MGYKDNLKYDVVIVLRDDKPVFEAVASFMSHGFALGFMRDNDLLYNPFSAREDVPPVWDMLYNGGTTCLFHNPSIPLLHASEFPSGTTKGDLAERASLIGEFDYSLPQPYVDMVVKTLHADMQDEKHELYRTIIGGVVWFYPKARVFGRNSGRPAALTKDANELLVRYVELTS